MAIQVVPIPTSVGLQPIILQVGMKGLEMQYHFSFVLIEMNTQPLDKVTEDYTDKKTIADSEGSSNGVEHFNSGGSPNIKVDHNQWKTHTPAPSTHRRCHTSFSISPLRTANPDEKTGCIKTSE